MSYEPRQLLPFAAVLMGVLSWRLALSVAGLTRSDFPAGSLSGKRENLAFTLLFILSVFGFVTCVAPKLHFSAAEHPRKLHAEYGNEISLAGELRGKLAPDKDTIIFSLNGFRMFWTDAVVKGFPQVWPVLEYVTGGPILCFREPDDLAKDLRELTVLAKGGFIPVIATDNDETLRKVLVSLEKEGVIDVSNMRRIPTSSGIFVDLSG